MATDIHHIDSLFNYLDEKEKQDILRMAKIQDDRPDILRINVGSYADRTKWMHPHRKAIAPLILRKRNLHNSDVLMLMKDGDFSIGNTSDQPQINVRISPVVPPDSAPEEHRNSSNRVRLTDLAAASAMMSEMFIVLGGVNVALGYETTVVPPDVSVSGGSIEFAVGGGLFASGIGLIVACSAGLVASPIVGLAAGATLASVGLIELAIDWKKKIAETIKIEDETKILRQEHSPHIIHQSIRLRDLDIKKKELDLEMARIRQQEIDKEQSEFAYSRLIPREEVTAQVEQWGITEEYANHVLNRSLPTYIALKQYFTEVEIKKDAPPQKK